jgi:FtsP/CotA-like multicopper oxidase with cupredoxin domain
VVRDGMPLACHEPEGPTCTANHLPLTPAGRLEAIVTGPPLGTRSALRKHRSGQGSLSSKACRYFICHLLNHEDKGMMATLLFK